MPSRRPPASGPPETRDPIPAFGIRLDQLDRELRGVYDRLGALADDLGRDVVEADRDPDWLAGLGRRHALGEIRSAILNARHAIHGGLIGIVRARPPQADPRRHPS